MVIRINGKVADITLELEHTVGAVLAGIESWLGNSGFRVSGLDIDGKIISGDAIPAAFEQEVAGIGSIGVKVCTKQELMQEALVEARHRLEALIHPDAYTASFPAEDWETSVARTFLSGELPDLCGMFDELFKTGGTGSGLSPRALISLIDERIREIGDPAGEFIRLENLVSILIEKLEGLPIDIQTGKDRRAAETVSLFSTTAEKLFRLFSVFRSRGYLIDTVDLIPIHNFLEEFGVAIEELLTAYSGKDAVLVGDLAEYEIAPRLRAFYAALKQSVAHMV
ncbi:MAG: hypothetical protein LBU18_06275 [Treponema sp.]|jgi:hypothetical protein|nr:hypothetical protein [Treponema sp.]